MTRPDGKTILPGLTAALALLLIGGCSLDVQAPESTLWEGELEPTGEEPALRGSVAAVSRETNTEVGVDVTGGDIGDRWVWRLREGSCDAPGEIVGSRDDYPVLVAEDRSEPDQPAATAGAVAQTLLSRTLDPATDYHAMVATEDAPDVPLTCGSLTR